MPTADEETATRPIKNRKGRERCKGEKDEFKTAYSSIEASVGGHVELSAGDRRRGRL